MDYKEYADQLKYSIKEFLEGINNIGDLQMLYGVARAAYRDKEAQKGGAT